ncbi:MAG TPA: ester cyclase [Paraburkholderia sp.]|uniref:ester cyclase n=1 Tax=Paraburkholderia sp. TaxID=1926495 RepID=UPI002B686D90|nr:ester cyclase [Paraburkholderia sp.]HTR08110.1 ester cyclase [Paraburkholderia sp.]
MSAESNKLLMSRFVEFINTACEALAEELVDANAIFHAPVSPDPFIGPRGYMEILGMMRSGFPDIQWTLEEMIAENDTVAARFIMRGTHRATFFGVPASGTKIEVQAVNFYRFSNGKIVEERGQPDLLALLQQIGAVPA